MLLFVSNALASHPQNHPHPRHCSIVSSVWSPSRWRRGQPKTETVKAFRDCPRWSTAKKRYYAYRAELRRNDIDRAYVPHWAPDYGGQTLPPYVIAALAEEAGKVVGVDVPGWTMEQVTIGESGRRPGSAGHDAGGTDGYGLWAVTRPFADPILGAHSWTYESMWNPAYNAIAMAEIYKAQGIGAWYGIGHVTDWGRHYRGHFDLRLVLGGRTLRQVVAG